MLGLDQHAQGLQLQMLDGKEKLGKRGHTKNKKYALLGALQALTKDQGYYSYDEYSEHVGIRVPSEWLDEWGKNEYRATNEQLGS